MAYNKQTHGESPIALERFLLALAIKSLNPTTVTKDKNWIKLGLPKRPTMIGKWKDSINEAIPYYGPKLKIWYIETIAKYFNVPVDYFVDDSEISALEFEEKIKKTLTISEINEQNSAKSESINERSKGNDYEITAIVSAVINRDILCVKELLSSGINPNIGTVDYEWAEKTVELPEWGARTTEKFGPMSALQLSSILGYTEIAEVLIDGGADIEHTGRRGLASFPPLYIASLVGHAKTVSVLINKGAEIYPWEEWCEINAFFLAAWNNHIDVLKILLKYSDVKDVIKSEVYDSLFSIALMNSHFDLVSFLLDKLGIEQFNKAFDLNFIEHALLWGDIDISEGYPNIMRLIVKNLTGIKKHTTILFLIYISIILNIIEMFKDLLKYIPKLDLLISDIDPSYTPIDRFFDYPVIEASAFSSPAIVELLILKGADPNIKGKITAKGLTPLMVAISFMNDSSDKNHLEIIHLLLKNDADVNKIIEQDIILDHYDFFGCIDFTEFTYIRDISLKSGTSALMIAAQKELDNIIELLIEFGADINLKREDGKTAITLAKNEHTAALIANLEYHSNKKLESKRAELKHE
jgi:ankyrin repeat protein